jgi:hypothetical protein
MATFVSKAVLETIISLIIEILQFSAGRDRYDKQGEWRGNPAGSKADSLPCRPFLIFIQCRGLRRADLIRNTEWTALCAIQLIKKQLTNPHNSEMPDRSADNQCGDAPGPE